MEDAVASLAVKAAIAIAGMLANKATSSVWNEACSVDPLPTFAEMVSSMRKVMSEELSIAALKKAQSELDGIIYFMKHDYPYCDTREKKDAKLRGFEDVMMIDVLPTLKRDDIKHVALTAYISAANLHLAMLQELAANRPDEGGRSKALTDMAHEHASWAQTVMDEAIRIRLGHVGTISHKRRSHYVPPGEVITVDYWEFIDNFPAPPAEFEDQSGTKDKLTAERNSYLADVEGKFKDSIKFEKYCAVINIWRAL